MAFPSLYNYTANLAGFGENFRARTVVRGHVFGLKLVSVAAFKGSEEGGSPQDQA